MNATNRRLTTRERITFLSRASRHMLAHPRQVDTLPRWVRDRNASPLGLRIPWWPYTLPAWLLETLPAGSRVFEFGAGGSTLWLEDHGFAVSSVESDAGWYSALRSSIRHDTTALMLVEPAATGKIASVSEPGYFDDYIAHIDPFEDETLDLVVVDGRCRVECATRAIPKLRPGGRLLFDDSDRERYQGFRQTVSGWESHSFTALRPGGIPPSPATVWTKP